MEISNMMNDQLTSRPVPPSTEVQQLEKQNPNVPQKIQEQVLRDATQGPSSPTAQNVQLLANTQAVSQLQVTAQQQIRQGYLDIKI